MTEINIKLLDITSASDGDVLKYVAANGSVEYGAAPGAASINTHTVTVSGGVFYIDSTATPILSFEPGSTYKFDQSDASNASHPLRFSTVSDGTHNSGSEYTTNVTTSGTPGSSGAYTQIVISYSTPTLYYYCSNHSGMGSSSIVGNPDSAANDYSTYTTVTGLINTVQANVTALPDSAANDYSTYNTLSNLIDTVQDNVVATSNTTNNWVNSNDYSTYITVTANLYNTYTSLVSDINLVQGNVTSLTSTVDSADANLYNTYITVTGLIDTVQSNVTTNTNNINTVQSNLTAITSSDLNDVNTAGVSTGDFLLHDGVQFLPVNFATEVNTYADARISVASIQDLSDVDGIDTPANGDTLVFDGTDFGFVNFNSETNSLFDTRFATKSTTDLAEGTNLYFTDARAVSAVESANLNLGSNNITTTGKILYSNMYATEGDLPSATTYHGMFAHVHGTGKSYFAHGGNWIKLLDETNSTTDNLTEGSTNLYYTDARVNTHLNVSTATSNQVLSWSGSDYTWIDQSTGSSSTWSNVSSNVTAAAGDKLFVDTSANPITITLPASPAFGSEIRVIDIKGTSANNKITLDNNGNNIEGITDSLEVNINRAAFGLVFYDATEGWVFIEK